MIDVSDNNGTIDWKSVHESGEDRAIIKIYEHVIDPYAVTNIHHARAVGMTIGVYAFAHPSVPPDVAAKGFLNAAHGHMLAGDIVPALDLELMEGHSLSQLADWKAEWFKVVDAAIGTHAMFYSYRSMLNFMYPYLNKNRPVWGATGGDQPSASELERWSYVQLGTISVPGIVGKVDDDRVLTPKLPAPYDPRIPKGL